jgi:sugar-specific transcriptional regulator TrmB
MILREQDAETLAAIGLTRTQARVYLALVRLGKAKARTVWKNSGVARQDIYRILTELQGKSLVERMVAVPAEFRAIPLQDGITVLLKHKAHELNEVVKKTEEIFERYRTNHQENATDKEGEFTLLITKAANHRRLHEAQISTKKSVDVIDSWESFKRSVAIHTESRRKCLERKVKFRCVTEKPEDGETIPRVIQTLMKNDCVELRHMPTRPRTAIRIDDGRQVTICIIKARYSLEAPSLFSDNPCVVSILQDYFELLWSNLAKDNPHCTLP